MSEKIKVFIADPIHEAGVTLLEEHNFLVTRGHEVPKTKIHTIISDYDALICRTATKIDARILEAGTKLKCVSVSSTGFDHIDLVTASQHNIAVLGLPPRNTEIQPQRDGNFISTAEYDILLTLAVLRKFHTAAQTMKEHRWEKQALMGHELFNKTVGIIGFGRIGKLVAERFLGFGTKVLWYDPYVAQDNWEHLGTKCETLSELCQSSDIITIHVRHTPETHHMINEETIAQMKDGVVIINTARAAIIDEAALIRNLNNHKIGHVALDVFHNEPEGVNFDLIDLPSVTATPHIGGSTFEAQERIALNTAKTLVNFILHNDRRNQINDIV